MKRQLGLFLGFVCLTGVVVGVQIGSTVLLSALSAVVGIGYQPLVIGAIIVGELVLLGAAVAVLSYYGDALGVTTPTGNGFVYATVGLLASVGIGLGSSAAASFFGVPFSADGGRLGLSGIWLVAYFVLSMTLVAFCEEMFFRRTVQHYLSDAMPVSASVAVAALLFSVSHIPAAESASMIRLAIVLGQVFLQGVVNGLVYWQTNNVVAASLTHGLFNALNNVSTFVA